MEISLLDNYCEQASTLKTPVDESMSAMAMFRQLGRYFAIQGFHG